MTYCFQLLPSNSTCAATPRPPGVIDTNAESNEREAAPEPRKAVKAIGPKASFEIHMALAHDGPPLSEGDDVAPALMDEWVTAYTAGWEELAPGAFLGEWSKAGAYIRPLFSST